MSLIAATVGAGTLAFPYAIMQNGIAFGGILILLGAIISYYSGMLLVEASNYTHRHKYEEMARILHGKNFAKLTSFCNLACLLGFAMSFIVYQKESLPLILMNFVDNEKLPFWVKDTFWGETFWGTLYTVSFHKTQPYYLVCLGLPNIASEDRGCTQLCLLYRCGLHLLCEYRRHFDILHES